MIGYLRGKVIDKTADELWLDVSGVGYRLRLASRLQGSSSIGDTVALYIHTNVREGAIELFGFDSRASLELFEVIISVSGIGPKIGLKVVAHASVDRIKQAVQTADISFFQGIPGIGKKGAQRIIVDLKGKLPVLKDVDLTDESEDPVVEALAGFGFAETEIKKALASLDDSLSEEDKIRQTLKILGRK